MPSSEKAEMMLANFVIPLCLRIGGNDRGVYIPCEISSLTQTLPSVAGKSAEYWLKQFE